VKALRGVVLLSALGIACAHRSPSPFDGRYETDELSPRTKVMLVAGGDDVANFAAEVAAQRRMWRAAGLQDDEIACYWAQPTERAWARDRRQYRRIAPALAHCRPATAARVLAEIGEVAEHAPPWFYLYVTTHGVQTLASEGSGWYLDASEREFLEQHALSLDADPKLRLQHVGNILAARRSGARDDVLVMTPATLSAALDRLPDATKKIVVLQGCFSGGFIDEGDALASLHNIVVLTAAAADRPSFGCGSGTVTTYWGGTLYRELRKRVRLGVTPPEVDWHAVHEAVSRRVGRKERSSGNKPSQPQFYSRM